MAKKVFDEEIDEDFIIASMKGVESTTPPREVQSEERMETKKRNREKKDDYESLYLKESTSVAREGKMTLIRTEYHAKIVQIIQMITGNKITMFSYIDNVLKQHFNMYEKELNTLYEKTLEGKKNEFKNLSNEKE